MCGTGFFVLLYNSFKCILTNHHIISKDLINNFIDIEIYNKNKVKILLDKNRYIKFYDDLDVTIIELKETDEIIKNIDFLYYDLNYKTGYEQYIDKKFLLYIIQEKEILNFQLEE